VRKFVEFEFVLEFLIHLQFAVGQFSASRRGKEGSVDDAV
jgi:hypothetical protein